jgi:hypothetical protein
MSSYLHTCIPTQHTGNIKRESEKEKKSSAVAGALPLLALHSQSTSFETYILRPNNSNGMKTDRNKNKNIKT